MSQSTAEALTSRKAWGPEGAADWELWFRDVFGASPLEMVQLSPELHPSLCFDFFHMRPRLICKLKVHLSQKSGLQHPTNHLCRYARHPLPPPPFLDSPSSSSLWLHSSP